MAKRNRPWGPERPTDRAGYLGLFLLWLVTLWLGVGMLSDDFYPNQWEWVYCWPLIVWGPILGEWDHQRYLRRLRDAKRRKSRADWDAFIEECATLAREARERDGGV